MDVLALDAAKPDSLAHTIAHLSAGQPFGEMALINGGVRTATIRAAEDSALIQIRKEKFDDLVAHDRKLAEALRQLGHSRALENLKTGGSDPTAWANVASASLAHLSRAEADKLLSETGQGAGMAIVLGNVLDTIPGCLVIGAKFGGFQSLSLTLMLGMFIGGIPEAAASGAMLSKAGYKARAIFGMWSGIVVVGIVAAALGKLIIGGDGSLTAIFAQALAGGAVLACVSHAMIPEAIHGGGSMVVLPTVAGFVFALYLALAAAFA